MTRRYVSLSVTSDSDGEWTIASRILLETVKSLIENGVMKYEIASNDLEDFMTPKETTNINGHDFIFTDRACSKVRLSLGRAGLTDMEIRDSIVNMQNEGIFFVERN